MGNALFNMDLSGWLSPWVKQPRCEADY